MAVKNVTEQSFDADVINAGMPVVVDYWADWCAPCKQIAPILDELAAEYDGRVVFAKVDTNAEPNLAAQRGILGLPTLEFWSNGQVVKSLTGGKSKNALTKAVEELL